MHRVQAPLNGGKRQMASKTRTFFLNAISLTASAILMRAIGMLFSAIVANKAGSEAMGLYSLLGSVYAFAITLATAGINLGTTRVISDALGVGDEALAKRSASKAILICMATGGAATLILLAFAGVIGENLLGDARTVTPLRILALTLMPIAICSCLSGYFTAVRRVKVNAAAQVVIQFIRIGATVFFLSFMVDQGTEKACIALVLGGALSEFLSLLFTFSLYLIDRRRLKGKITVENSGGTVKKLLSITLPVTFSACIRSALSMVQHILVPRGLKASGRSWEAALSSYGALHGMAMPLILFPSAITSAFSGLLIPEISECCVTGDSERLKRVSYRALTLSLAFSIGVSGIILFFSEQFGMLIYGNAETATYIRIMAPLIPVMYIDSTVDAILKGSGHQVYSMNVNIADTLTACLFALFLIPHLGIWGYVISIYATEILNTSLSLIKMAKISQIKFKIFHQIVMPIICIVGATNLSLLIIRLLHFPISGALSLTLGVIFTVAFYIAFLLMTKTVGKDEKEFLYPALMTEKSYNKRFRSI